MAQQVITKADQTCQHTMRMLFVDPFESSTKGLISQMKGNLRWARFTAATVYIDRLSELSFLYMQRDQTSTELLKSKTAVENCARSHGMQVESDHKDNGSMLSLNTPRGNNRTYCTVK